MSPAQPRSTTTRGHYGPGPCTATVHTILAAAQDGRWLTAQAHRTSCLGRLAGFRCEFLPRGEPPDLSGRSDVISKQHFPRHSQPPPNLPCKLLHVTDYVPIPCKHKVTGRERERETGEGEGRGGEGRGKRLWLWLSRLHHIMDSNSPAAAPSPASVPPAAPAALALAAIALRRYRGDVRMLCDRARMRPDRPTTVCSGEGGFEDGEGESRSHTYGPVGIQTPTRKAH
jgi:hypothetical protein